MSETSRLLHECAERWQLDLGEPFSGGYASRIVTAATLPDGTEAVLKLQLPHRESEHEAAALGLWDGEGARLAAGAATSSTVSTG